MIQTKKPPSTCIEKQPFPYKNKKLPHDTIGNIRRRFGHFNGTSVYSRWKLP